jgi:molybdenum cofactor synthesis domain-containing protein
MVEKTALEGTERVQLRDRPRPLQNVCKRGQDIALGSTVLESGRKLRAVELAVLASVGCDPVSVFRRPRVSVLTSGDELVAPGERPGEGQIRESNTFELTAMSRAAGAQTRNLGVVHDDPELLERAFREALEECDLLITTGGVSMGKYDLVGGVLERIGVTAVFHKVAIKPGKPLWFGMWKRVPVFALPGNPVSCLVNHAVFVRPALERLSSLRATETVLPRARWGGSDLAPNPRERHVPVRVGVGADGVSRLDPVDWNGSADVVGLARAEALAVVPMNRPIASGEWLAYRSLS